VLLKGTTDIEHDTDGSLSIDIYAKMPRLRTDGKGPQELIIAPTEKLSLTTITQVSPNIVRI
jgi:hypothetical protein